MVRESVKNRRLLFNCDGHSVWQQAGGNVEAWIENVFTGLVDSPVDALLWCDGAGGNTANYDSKVLERTGQRIGKMDPALLRAIKEGYDPPRVVVEEAHQRGLDVFYSFRINDCHDAFMPEEWPTFKVEHPEWQLGEEAHYGPKTALNFAYPEVRALKFRTVEEIFEKYDFDGIELDLLRGIPFFRPFYEPRHHYLLTDLLRTIRHHLDERARRRGRRIEIAIRVDENVTACRLDGFDLETWLAEDLLDILILGSGTIDIEVEAFRRLVAGTHVRIYPCLYGWPSRYNPIPVALARGLAANYWHQGADGIYLFNWFPHESKFHHQIGLLREIGDPATLAGRELMFAADRGFEDKPDDYYPHNWRFAPLPAELWPTDSGTPLRVPVMVGAQSTEGARLRVEVTDLRDRAFMVTVNNHVLERPIQKEDGWWTVDIPAGVLVQGVNQIGLSLQQLAQALPPPKVQSLEVYVEGTH